MQNVYIYIQSVVTQIKESNLTYFSEVCPLHLRWWLLCAAMGNFCWSSMLANFARVKNHCKILSVICQQQLGILSNYNQVLGTTILETLGICYADTPETSFTAKWRYPKKHNQIPKAVEFLGIECMQGITTTVLSAAEEPSWPVWHTSSELGRLQVCCGSTETGSWASRFEKTMSKNWRRWPKQPSKTLCAMLSPMHKITPARNPKQCGGGGWQYTKVTLLCLLCKTVVVICGSYSEAAMLLEDPYSKATQLDEKPTNAALVVWWPGSRKVWAQISGRRNCGQRSGNFVFGQSCSMLFPWARPGSSASTRLAQWRMNLMALVAFHPNLLAADPWRQLRGDAPKSPRDPNSMCSRASSACKAFL